MIDNQSARDGTQEKLAECLRRLCKGCGVHDGELVSLLRGELAELQQRWSVPLDEGIEATRRIITTRLLLHVERLRPRTRMPSDEYYEIAVKVSFNITRDRALHAMNLQDRRSWLASNRGISESTSYRYLIDATNQIAKALVGDEALAGRSSIGRADSSSTVPPLVAQPPIAQLAHLMTLSGAIRAALEARRDFCCAKGRAFYTFDLLLALVDMPDSRIAQCFDEVKDGLSAAIRRDLLVMPNPDKSVHAFTAFEWVERRDVQLAWQLALQDGSAVVTDIHLFIAVLDGSSETNVWLKATLKEDYLKLKAIADRVRRDGPRNIKSPTPDVRL